jgi:Phosphodiester glycosidase
MGDLCQAGLATRESYLCAPEMCSSWLAVLVAFILLFLAVKGESDSETILYPLQIIPVPSSLTRETNLTILSPIKNSLLSRPAYAITTTAVWSVVVPGHGLERTSVQAAKNYPHCIYATNGGPFQKDGSTVGAVVTNGRIVGENFDGVGFGMGTQCDQKTIQNNCSYWVIGTVDSVAHAHALGLEQFVTGFDWLVYNGRNVGSSNSSTELSEQAPRTAIGLTTRGHLLLLVADGCERWYVENTLGGPIVVVLATMAFPDKIISHTRELYPLVFSTMYSFLAGIAAA